MQNIQKAHAAPRCKAKSKRTGQLQRCGALASAGCTALAGAHQVASGMEITGTALGQMMREVVPEIWTEG
jgi:hypothetical protein